MRILHTSDWHLGRSFGPVSLRADQEAFCDWVVELAVTERVDLVVVAGDVYDRAVAPSESIALFCETLQRLRHGGATVAVIAGNHDSPDRLAPYDDLLDVGGVFVRGGYGGADRVISLDGPDGPLDLVLLPFLEPRAAPDSFGESVDVPEADGTPDARDADLAERRRRRTHESVLRAAIASTADRLTSPRSLAVAHAFVIGGEPSESERQLEVGGTGAVPASLFEPFSYTALGHLHRPQDIATSAGPATVRYSGTPLPYSFSEDHEKSVTLVDMGPTGGCEVRTETVPVGRRVTTVRGPIDELCQPTSRPGAHDRFVRAVVTDRETVLDAKARLEQVYPFVVEVRLEPLGGVVEVDTERPAISEVDPLDATRRFWEAVEGSAPDDATESLLVDAIGAAARGQS